VDIIDILITAYFTYVQQINFYSMFPPK